MWLVLQGNYPGTNQSAIHSNYNQLYMSGSIHFLIQTPSKVEEEGAAILAPFSLLRRTSDVATEEDGMTKWKKIWMDLSITVAPPTKADKYDDLVAPPTTLARGESHR